GVILNREKYKLSHTNLNLYMDLADINRNLHQNQLTDSLSASEWDVKYSNQQDQVHIDSLNMVNALNNLKLAMNFPPGTTLQISDTLVTAMDKKVISTRYHTEDLPAYRSVVLELQLNKSRQQQVKRGYYPVLNAYGFVGSQYYDDTFSPFTNSLRWHKQTYVGLKIELPVFDGLQKSRENAAYSIHEENLNRQKEDLASEITRKALIQQNNMTISSKQAAIKRKELDLSRSLFGKTIQNYRTGLSDMKDVSNAELDMNMKEQAYISALYALLQARLQYEQLVWPGTEKNK
ncbi:MAG TPA: TolC family protein, partial [Bacteroidales bacterium]|nr:TolC family protein [Bacteroidales bacterium]